MHIQRLLQLVGSYRKALGSCAASGPDTGKASQTAGASRSDRTSGPAAASHTPPPPDFRPPETLARRTRRMAR